MRTALQAVFVIVGLIGAVGFFLGYWRAFDGLGWLTYIGLLGMWATGATPNPTNGEGR